jgi:hypothetical protein
LQGKKSNAKDIDCNGKNKGKRASTAFRQSFQIALWLLFSIKRLMGGGYLAEVHRQRDAKEIAKIAIDCQKSPKIEEQMSSLRKRRSGEDSGHRETRISPPMNADDTERKIDDRKGKNV